ncbi:Protein tyrosine and serine/threonine kinase [Pelomyxa schiedti]|nr:Protein tyrosine and serine/threonine kinase [Pelomyxa schiedti]
MEVEKRFGVDDNQQVVSLVGATQEEVSLSDTSLTLHSLLPQPTLSSSLGKLGTEVAVKTLLEVIASPHNVERFKAEAEIVCGLRHPSIVKYLGVCTITSGKLLIVSELMCCSLRQLLRQIDSMKQRLAIKQFVSISLGVANGMDNLHRQNIMHRDLSSNNILFDSNGVPKICDFAGVSREINRKSLKNVHKQLRNRGGLVGFGMLMAEMINGAIIDSTLDKLPLHSQANFLGAQMRTLSPPNVAEVKRLCYEAGESAIAHCLSRRNAGLAAVNYFTHSCIPALDVVVWNNSRIAGNSGGPHVHCCSVMPLHSREEPGPIHSDCSAPAMLLHIGGHPRGHHNPPPGFIIMHTHHHHRCD